MNDSGFVVVMVRGARAGRRFVIHEDEAVVGRDPRCDVPLHNADDSLASARHVSIRREGPRFRVEDLGSTNGTFIDGARLKSPIAVVAGTEIECGPDGPVFRIELPTPAASGRTGFYQALMRTEVERVATRFRLIVGALVVVILAGVSVAVWYFVWGRADSAALQADEKIAEGIVRNNGDALYMLIAKDAEGELTGYCTAFAVDESGLLATNAHCVKSLEAYRSTGQDTVARMNSHPDKTWTVERWKKHPDYDNTPFSPDVAILKLALGNERLPAVVTLSQTVGLLEAGSEVFVLGFPGKVMNEDSPAADLRVGIISRLTTFANAPGDGQSVRLVWHTALTSKGTSGSPIFNRDGEVIAVNNGGLSAREVLVKDPDTGELKSETAYEATGLNFGIRADILESLLPR